MLNTLETFAKKRRLIRELVEFAKKIKAEKKRIKTSHIILLKLF